MADVISPEKRSWVMSRIRGRGTGIEVRVEGMLRHLRCGYKSHPAMFGNPDFVIPKAGIVIFCDGDFWHGHRYGKKRSPPGKFWRKKIEGNMHRDRRVSSRLRRKGWSVLRFWERDIDGNPDKCIEKIQRKIRERAARRGSKRTGQGSSRRAARPNSR